MFHLKNKEKGSVTIFVVMASMLFIVVFLFVNIKIINDKSSQQNYVNKTSSYYNVNKQDMETAYQKSLQSTNEP